MRRPWTCLNTTLHTPHLKLRTLTGEFIDQTHLAGCFGSCFSFNLMHLLISKRFLNSTWLSIWVTTTTSSKISLNHTTEDLTKEELRVIYFKHTSDFWSFCMILWLNGYPVSFQNNFLLPEEVHSSFGYFQKVWFIFWANVLRSECFCPLKVICWNPNAQCDGI